MALFLISIITGFIGLNIGFKLKSDFFAYIFCFIGFISPSLFVLDSIYKEIKKKSN